MKFFKEWWQLWGIWFRWKTGRSGGDEKNLRGWGVIRTADRIHKSPEH